MLDTTFVRDPEDVGIDALSFLASHDDLLKRFLEMSGLEATQLRTEVEKPEFFIGLLDFYLGNEDDTLDLASQLNLPPAAIGRARNALAKTAGLEPIELPA